MLDGLVVLLSFCKYICFGGFCCYSFLKVQKHVFFSIKVSYGILFKKKKKTYSIKKPKQRFLFTLTSPLFDLRLIFCISPIFLKSFITLKDKYRIYTKKTQLWYRNPKTQNTNLTQKPKIEPKYPKLTHKS